jgi:hypothetical protein
MAKTRRSPRPSTARPPLPQRSHEGAAVAIVCTAATIAATLERWWFPRAWGEAGSLTSAFYYGDAPRFVEYAIAILQGRVFDNGIPYHPPGWPLALAGFLKLAGAVHGPDVVVPVGAVKLFIACLSGLTVGVAALLAYDIGGMGVMLAVALIGPFQFGHIVQGTVANSEALYGLAVVAAMFAAFRWWREDSPHRLAWAALAGAIGGIAMLVRAEFLACAIVMAVVPAWSRRPRWWREPALFLCLFCTMLVPTTVWHWRSLSAFNAAHVGRVAGPLPRFAPVTSYGPFNFAMANHPAADGGPNRDHPLLDRCSADTASVLSAGELDLACPAIYDLYVNGYAIGLAWLVGHPVDAAALMTRKIGMTVGFLSHGYLIDAAGSGVDGVRRRVDVVDPDGGWLMPIHGLLIVGGLVVLRRRPMALAVMLLPIVALAGSTLLFYGYVRLGVSYLPAIWVLQGAAAAYGVKRLWSWRPPVRTLVGVTVGAIVLLLGYEAARIGVPREVVLDGPRAPGGALMQDETLLVHRVR